MIMKIPDITDVLKARKSISGFVRRTPLEYSYPLSEMTGARVYLKLENQQHAGSFKIRGAMNKIFSMTEDELRRGVVTASSGNHAQGLATAAFMLKARAVIFVPEACPETKKASVQARGGQYVELRVTGAQYDDTESAALKYADDEGLVFVSAYEDTHIAAGQGTLVLEMFEDEPELDAIICPLSGGWLLTGVTVASRALRPSVEIWGSTAKNNPNWTAGWESGEVVPVDELDSLADALGGAASRKLFGFLRNNITGVTAASEEEIAEAMALVHRLHHTVIEGAAGTAVAALVSGKIDLKGRAVGVVISGGNVDDAKLVKILSQYGSR